MHAADLKFASPWYPYAIPLATSLRITSCRTEQRNGNSAHPACLRSQIDWVLYSAALECTAVVLQCATQSIEVQNRAGIALSLGCLAHQAPILKPAAKGMA